MLQKCDFSATSNSGLKMHIERRHSTSSDVYPCDTCNYIGKHKFNLKLHKKNVHGTKERIQCNSCDKILYKKELSNHLRNVHGNEKHPCDKCSYVGKSRDYLKSHLKMTHRNSDKKCKICEYKTKQLSNLNTHIKNVHFKETAECPICSKVLSKHSLSGHVKKVHEDTEFKFCTMCNFKSRS